MSIHNQDERNGRSVLYRWSRFYSVMSGVVDTWYVDTVGGSDSNDATSEVTPVQNWGELQGKGLKTGHTVKVKKNSVVPVATMYADALVIVSYGDGVQAVIQSVDLNGFSAPITSLIVTGLDIGALQADGIDIGAIQN